MNDFTFLEHYLSTLPAQGHIGLDARIHCHGKPVWSYQTGFFDREAGIPVRTDAYYRLYSLTKVITCTAALQLYERGEFLLTDPLDAYLPEFHAMTVREPDGSLRPASRAITLRDLFTMTAGFTYQLDLPAIRQGVAETAGKAPTREMMRCLAREPLAFDPGTRFEYSVCHDVLGAVIEVISGMRFGDYLQKNIFTPLGIRDISFRLPPQDAGRLAPLYRYDAKTHTASRTDSILGYTIGTEYESGGAGLIGSLDAYQTFADALCQGGVLLSEATTALMTLPQLTPAQAVGYHHTAFGYNYGLGVRVMENPALGGANSPVGEFGWSGAAGTHLIVDRAHGLTFVLGQHLLDPPADIYRGRIRSCLYAGLDRN